MTSLQIFGFAAFTGTMFLLSDVVLTRIEGYPPYISRKRLYSGAFWIAFFVLYCLSSSAQAHSWYSAECCAEKGCHPVPCETLSSGPKGSIEYTPLSKLFESSKVRPSQDSKCHVCLHGSEQSPICVFTQQGV